MSDPISLCCLVVDKACNPVGDVFKAKVAPNDYLIELKRQIVTLDGTGPTKLKQYPMCMLLLWKPKGYLADDPSTLYDAVRALRMDYKTCEEDSGMATWLIASTKVSQAFNEELKKGCVHVLVQLPEGQPVHYML
jgi:hypothetical protein